MIQLLEPFFLSCFFASLHLCPAHAPTPAATYTPDVIPPQSPH